MSSLRNLESVAAFDILVKLRKRTILLNDFKAPLSSMRLVSNPQFTHHEIDDVDSFPQNKKFLQSLDTVLCRLLLLWLIVECTRTKKNNEKIHRVTFKPVPHSLTLSSLHLEHTLFIWDISRIRRYFCEIRCCGIICDQRNLNSNTSECNSLNIFISLPTVLYT